MIYTRNKDSFKSKTIKSSTSSSTHNSRNPTVSENGFNLVEQLKQRIENKNKKTQVLNEGAISHQTNKPRSKSPKKITISKNFQKQSLSIKAQQVIVQEKRNSEHKGEISVSNPFSRIKKDQFMQLVHLPQSLPVFNTHQNSFHGNKIQQSTQIHRTKQSPQRISSQLVVVEEYYRSNMSTDGQKRISQGQQEQLRKIYQSPIQELQLSGYSSNNEKSYSSNREPSPNIQQPLTSSKEVYQNKVKKWKEKAYSSQNPSQSPAKTSQIQKNTNQSVKNNPNSLSLSSGIIRQAIVWNQSFHIPKPLPAQKQYLELLQNEISTLKLQLFNSVHKIKTLQTNFTQITFQNQQLQKTNVEVSKKLEQMQNKLNYDNENSFVIEKYERMFGKMRNLLIVNAMELIETKNFLQLQFSTSQSPSLANSPQNRFKLSDSVKKGKKQTLLDSEDFQSRIHSINECIAKVEQTIEISQKVISLNNQRVKSQQNTHNFIPEITLKDLEETITYKDKIIKKLKQDVNSFKQGQINPSLSQTRDQKTSQIFVKPYSYVDEIHLLRHQINRLTDQNCHFYQKYSQLKKQVNEQQDNLGKFPNQSRIKQIESLIGKLNKNSKEEQVSSKVQYWTQGKAVGQGRKISQTGQKGSGGKSQSKSKQIKNMRLFQKPKNIDQAKQNKQQQKNGGQQIVYRQTIETYSSNSKQQRIEYSREQFSELVKQFKSSLSGLTPEKKQISQSSKENPSNKDKRNLNSGLVQEKSVNDDNEEIELPTFRTPKQEQEQQLNHSDQKQNGRENNAIQENNEDFIETISRLEYEKEFLASERENLIKENQRLIEQIQSIQAQLNADKFTYDKLSPLEEEVYKLKFQNQQLVDRVVEAQNQLLKHQNISQQLPQSSQINKLLQLKEKETLTLTKQNIELKKAVESLQNEKQKLTKNLQSTRNLSSTAQSDDPMSFVLAPSFQSLINFLRKLPQQKREYHQILLKLIEGYEKKVSQLREQNVCLKTGHKQIQDILNSSYEVLEKVLKHFSSDKSMRQSYDRQSSERFIFKLSSEIKKNLNQIQQINGSYFSKINSPSSNSGSIPHSFNSNTTSSFISKVNYHLMFLRSLVQGIGESDLELIEAELSDYLKQLKKRIPTVMEREEYEESYQSSLNTSMVNDQDNGGSENN